MDSGGVCPTLNAFDNATETRATVVAFDMKSGGSSDVSPTLRARPSTTANEASGSIVGDSSPSGVRRLTPVECERLQGFPDGWTDGQADSNRYRQMGNAVTVNVAEWVGRMLMENT